MEVNRGPQGWAGERDSPTMTREQSRTPLHHMHGDLTSLASQKLSVRELLTLLAHRGGWGQQGWCRAVCCNIKLKRAGEEGPGAEDVPRGCIFTRQAAGLVATPHHHHRSRDSEPRWPLELLRGSQAPRRAVCGTRGSFQTMHGGGCLPKRLLGRLD